MHLLALVGLVLGADDGIDLIKWLGSEEAFKQARSKKTERWVLIYKERPKNRSCQRFEAGTLLDERVRSLIELNFHPVLTWDPSSPRTVNGKEVQIEPEIWKKTQEWNADEILWLVSPDKKIRVPVPYVNSEKQRPTTPAELEAKIREAFKKHGAKFVEPKQDEGKPKRIPGRADHHIERLYALGRRAGVKIYKVSKGRQPRRTGGRRARPADEREPVFHFDLSVGGEFYSLAKLIFLLEEDDPPVLVRRWRIRESRSRKNGQDRELGLLISFNMSKEHDLYYWKALDRIWEVLDGEKTVWLTDLQFVDETRARALLKECREGPRGRRDPYPPYAVSMKLKMYGNDLLRPAEVKKALVENEYLAKHFPISNSDLKILRLEEGGAKIMAFQVIMVAEPEKK